MTIWPVDEFEEVDEAGAVVDEEELEPVADVFDVGDFDRGIDEGEVLIFGSAIDIVGEIIV